MQVYDLEILEDINSLVHVDTRVMIYGAADKGEEIYKLLNAAGKKDIIFVDRDKAKWSDIVISPNDFQLMVSKSIQQVYLIACVNDVDGIKKYIEKLLKESNGNIRFVSYYSVKLSLYINRKALFKESDWVNKKYNVINTINELNYDLIGLSILKKMFDASDNTIWVFQPGKVGSSTLCSSLAPFRETIHQHSLIYHDTLGFKKLSNEWRSARNNFLSEPRKIITMVREPISRDYSAFWQAFGSQYKHALRMPILSGNLQEMYDQFVECLNKGVEYASGVLKSSFPQTWRDEFLWFDEEYKNLMDIDIFKYSFDREKGYTIINTGNFSVFLYKLEKYDLIRENLAEFVGIDSFQSVDTNTTKEKECFFISRIFKKKLKISKEYVDHYYKGNRYMDYFYTEEEKKAFLSDWKENITT